MRTYMKLQYTGKLTEHSFLSPYFGPRVAWCELGLGGLPLALASLAGWPNKYSLPLPFNYFPDTILPCLIPPALTPG